MSTKLQRQAAFEASFLGFLHRQFTAPKPLPAHTDLTGQVAVVTGLPRLDIAILNAGLIETRFTVVPATEHEVTLQVNYLSTALLAMLLLPVLKAKKARGAAGPPVLTIVSSDMAYKAEIETAGPVLRQLDAPDAFSGFDWYGKSKLLLMLFVSKLAEQVDGDDVVVNVVNPGMTSNTAFFRGLPTVLAKPLAVCQWLLARPVHVAATTYVDAAAARGAESHGAFLSDWTIKPFPKMYYTPEGAGFRERLWDETMEEFNFAGGASVISRLGRGRALV
ncbi:hypothetical protein HIM_11199 [Hirsutella minnesotensis 3608]|uniref:Uncharacterized protein n=1 Tax=Hirsutella minnesotensis 3608 TaxID=1043627 RepID=A0A0F7ZRD1_9HYPO|nr:hypothetical protein HIM_11199 [Hirsutella minnesotensis 3608]